MTIVDADGAAGQELARRARQLTLQALLLLTRRAAAFVASVSAIRRTVAMPPLWETRTALCAAELALLARAAQLV